MYAIYHSIDRPTFSSSGHAFVMISRCSGALHIMHAAGSPPFYLSRLSPASEATRTASKLATSEESALDVSAKLPLWFTERTLRCLLLRCQPGNQVTMKSNDSITAVYRYTCANAAESTWMNTILTADDDACSFDDTLRVVAGSLVVNYP